MDHSVTSTSVDPCKAAEYQW